MDDRAHPADRSGRAARGRHPAGAALPDLRLGRRRQVDADRPAALRAEPHLRRPVERARTRLAQARHHRRGGRFRAAARRPRSRARAGHHHRRRLPLFLDAAPLLHRRRHARPRAIHPQHGDRRLQRRARRAAGGRAQGPVAADKAPRHHRQPARHPLRGARRQQDRPGRLRPGDVRQNRCRVHGLRRHARLQGDHGDPDLRALRRQRVEPQRQHALVPGAGAAELSRSRRRRGRPRRQAVPPAGAIGQPAERRLPRLCRHHRRRQPAHRRRDRRAALGAHLGRAIDHQRRHDGGRGASRRRGHRDARRRDRHRPRRHARRRARASAGRRPVRRASGLDVERRGCSRAAPISSRSTTTSPSPRLPSSSTASTSRRCRSSPPSRWRSTKSASPTCPSRARSPSTPTPRTATPAPSS